MDNNGVIMPEIIIQKAITSMIALLKTDYAEQTDKSETLIAYFFKKDGSNNDVNFQTVNYYDQAVELFTSRKIQVNMGYNMEIADIANIHILLPSESSRFLGIGADENYVEDMVVERTVDVDGEQVPREFASPIFTKTFDSNYQMLITSTNIFEVLIIYNALKMGFLSLYENIEFQGLRNIKMGGGDVNIQKDLVPPNIFHRSFTLSFFYEMNTPRHFRERLIRNFTSTGIIN